MNNSNPTQTYQKIKHLREFYVPDNKLFKEAQNLPVFFLTNLVDDARIVKYLHNDPQANIRVFYYQYLKLCFQIENVDYQSYIQKIYQLIRTQGFQFYFEADDNQKQIKNAQYKSLLVDFFEIMNSGSLTVDTVLNQYPILDEVFTNFFRTVVMLASVATQYDSYINKNELFDFLSSFFSVDISSYDKCLKFIQSDIFVYQQDPQNIYMAFIKDEQQQQIQESYQLIGSQNKNQSQVSNTQQKEKLSQSKQQLPQKNNQIKSNIEIKKSKQSLNSIANINGLKPQVKTVIKESYIQGQFADYTSTANITSLGHNASNVNQTINQNPHTQNEDTYDINVNFINQKNSPNFHQQLTKVSSAENKISFNVKMAESDDQNSLSQKKIVHKGNSLPNLLSNNSQHKLAQSFYQHNADSAIVPDIEQSIQKSELQNSIHSKNSHNSIQLKKLNHYFNQQPTKDPGFSGIQQHQTQPHSSGQLNKNIQNSVYNKLYQYDEYQKSITANVQSKFQTKDSKNIYNYPNNQKSYKRNSYLQKSGLVNQQNDRSGYQIPKQTIMHRPQVLVPTLLSQSNVGSKTFLTINQYDKPINQIKSGNLKLNVTKQFTNSIVMKSMKQPYKSNVYQIRQRARQFRKNIAQNVYYSHIQSQKVIQKPQTKIIQQTHVDTFNKAKYQYKQPTIQQNIVNTANKNTLQNRPYSMVQNTINTNKFVNYDKPSSHNPYQIQPQYFVKINQQATLINNSPNLNYQPVVQKHFIAQNQQIQPTKISTNIRPTVIQKTSYEGNANSYHRNTYKSPQSANQYNMKDVNSYKSNIPVYIPYGHRK